MGTTSDGDRPWQSYHTAYTNAKAGMEGVDKEKVQRIIYEMSKGSKYFENEKRKEAYIRQKVENLHTLCAKLTDKDMPHFQEVANKKILELEASRDLSKIWLHIDMDAFYAAVETLENPSLKGKPMAVGSMSMICTANYEARKFGVRAAMPGFIAHKLCPDLVFVPTNFEKYTYYSELTRKVFRRYDPDFIAASLDEAYLNITESCNERGLSSEEVAAELRNNIYEETGLTCSVGVAPNRLLAKIGGIGKVTETILKDVLGINTCEELLQKGAFLCALFSHCSTDFFLSVGLGLGRTDTPEQKLRKSISSERTFSATGDEPMLLQKLADIAETLSNDMQKECLWGRTLTLKLKTASFEVRTRAVSLQKFIQSKEEIQTYASKVLKAELPLSLRLMGLRMSQFRDDKCSPRDPMQKTLASFVISGNVTASATCVNKSSISEFSDEHQICDAQTDLSVHRESSASNDNKISLSYETNDVLASNQLSCGLKFASTSNADGIENMGNGCSEKCDSVETKNEMISNFSGHKTVAASSQKVELSWVDGYICSVCGIEMPPSFIEERQEHSDYHLAEMLQEEESVYGTGHLTQERSVRKALQAKENARKKLKSSPNKGRHIPIDAFFIKGKKNL
ncbi:DNA polymerase kappa isoform X2 [Phoenix dactylifera]|uniref:DNA polymerase kappa n=1 Tax=Phoenix dactylifera TaxID=42345 RepID=A0A8B8Z8B2_PHODC|nr:DNA polymerase kappa isoform X2 [Phoenix dactylifera]